MNTQASTINERPPTFSPDRGDISSLLLTAFAFFLPLSTSLTSILALLVVAAVFVQGNMRARLEENLENPVACAILAYVLLHVLGLLWTDNLTAGLDFLKKQWKLALFFFFLVSVNPLHRRRYLWAFVAGVGVIVLGTLLVWCGVVVMDGLDPDHLTRGTFHVVYNPFLALACFILGRELFSGPRKKSRITMTAIVILLALFTASMFLTRGRAGQTAFFFLLALLLFQFLRRRFCRPLLPALLSSFLVVVLVFSLLYTVSPVFRQRVLQARDEIAHFGDQSATSVGMRLHFLINSLEIIRQYPLSGVGTGDFQSAYRTVNDKNSPTLPVTDNPHNQYVLVTVLFGIPGLIVLGAILFFLFREAYRSTDEFGDFRAAVPLLFAVIMLSESYLLIHGSAFLFVLMGAIACRRAVVPPPPPSTSPPDSTALEKWLILSHCFNMDGRAASQTITDRLPFLLQQGVLPLVVSAPTGTRDQRFSHVQVLSPAPSGLLFEMRHIFRTAYAGQAAQHFAKGLLTFFLLPFYLLESLFIHLDSQWSWFIGAYWQGLRLVKKFQPAVIYSTGGPPSAHLAGFLLHLRTRIPWCAELHDPLIYDNEPRQWRQYYRFKKWLEKLIFIHARAVIFFSETALCRARRRHPASGTRGMVLRPGANPPGSDAPVKYRKKDRIHFAHFGSMAPKRNLCAFLDAAQAVIKLEPRLADILRLDIFGSEPDENTRACLGLHALPAGVVTLHGRIEIDPVTNKTGRHQITEAMAMADVLLLIHGTGIMCDEYIPSKTYEYLLAGRPILGFAEENSELAVILKKNGHRVVPETDIAAIRTILRQLIDQWEHDRLPFPAAGSPYTVAAASWSLISLFRELQSGNQKGR